MDSDDFHTMKAKVEAGLNQARKLVGDMPAMLELIDSLERTWDSKASQLLIIVVGLSAFRFRNREQTIKALEDIRFQIEAGKFVAMRDN